MTIEEEEKSEIDFKTEQCLLTPDAVCLPLEYLDPREKLSVLEERFSLAESFCGMDNESLRDRIIARFEEVNGDLEEMETRDSEKLQRAIDSLLEVIENQTYLLEDRILETRSDLILTPEGLMVDPSKSWFCCNFLWF